MLSISETLDLELRQPGRMEAGDSSSSSKFKFGDTVSVLRHGKAIIINDFVEDPQHERFGRYQVSDYTS